MSESWVQRVREALPASRVAADAPLRQATTLRIGGPAQCLVDLESEDDLLALLAILRQEQMPLHVLGRGSNLLVPDAGLRGVVLRLGRGFQSFQVQEPPQQVWAGAGLANATFVERCREVGLGGMEFLVAVPGSIGGAVAMNAGAHQQDTQHFLRAVRYVELKAEGDPAVREAAAEEFAFGYRHSPLRGQDGRLVLSARFALEPSSDVEIQRHKERFQAWRRETQPRDYPNCGSVFKNPPGDFAARLIDQAGLKGLRRGDAQVSEKHANFIVNRGQASAQDVLEVIDAVRQTVYQRTGTMLELELQVL